MKPKSKDPYDKLRYDFEALAKEVIRSIPVPNEGGANLDVGKHTDIPHKDTPHGDSPHYDHSDAAHEDWGYRPSDEHVRYPDLRVLGEIVSTLQRLEQRLSKLEAAQGKKSRPSR